MRLEMLSWLRKKEKCRDVQRIRDQAVTGQQWARLSGASPSLAGFRSPNPGRGLCLLSLSESRFPRRAFPGLHGRYSRRPAMPAWLQCMERGPDQPIGID